MHIVIIGGGGTVGTTVAYTLAADRPEVDISLLDIDEAVTLAYRVIVTGADPGTVQSTYLIETEHPRERTSRKFGGYVARIRDELGSPVDISR